MDSYYVYTVSMGEEIIYVGKGKDDRFKHVLSGKSHNFKLNKFYFEHLLLSKPLPVVEIVEYFPNEIKALKYEKFLISEYLPECNIRGKVNHSAENLLKVFKDDYSYDSFISPVPDDMIGLESYVKERYEDYLQGTWVLSPKSLRTFIKDLTRSSKYSNVIEHLESLWSELPDMRKDNGGHNKDEFSLRYDLDEKETRCVRNRKSYLISNGKDTTEEDLIKTLNKFRRKNGGKEINV